jgi:hypothetical protein
VNLDAIRGLTQPDQRSCGPSSLVAAHMLVDGRYRPASFSTDVLALHRSLTAPSFAGRAQLPWPRALGTPPWAVARAMSTYAGVPYRTRVLRLGSRASLFSSVVASVTAGHPCPLYVGSTWLPRHVVLAVAPSADGLQVYNPGRGSIDELTRASFLAGELTDFGRWTQPWFAVLPRGREVRRPTS